MATPDYDGASNSNNIIIVFHIIMMVDGIMHYSMV